MRQVRTCDFCGDDAAGLYEPYPPSVPDGPRLLLCAGCRERLSSVVDPLVARLEGSREPDTDARPAPRGEEAAPVGDVGGSGSDTDASGTARGSEPTDGGPPADGYDPGGRPLGDRQSTPPGYRKVMRFLENRELPVDRTEAQQLAAEAYELDEETVTAAIDHAVRYGRLREVDGQLKR